MSTLYRRLHGIFSGSSKSSRPPKPKLQKPQPPPSTLKPQPDKAQPSDSRRASVSRMFKERDLRTVVDQFKTSSDVSWFRARHVIYAQTVRRLAAAGHFSWIEEILEHQKKYSNISCEGFAVRIMTLYGKAGMFDHARKLFDEMPQLNCQRTVLSLNALLAACVSSKKYDRIEEIFREVPKELNVEPDVVSYNTIVKGLCEMGSVDSAVLVLDEMEKNGVQPNNITFNMILDEFYQNGRFEEGDGVWANMETKSIAPCSRSYNGKLRGLVAQNRTSEAVDLFQELSTKGVKPDIFTFNALIKGFCDDKNLEEAKRWYAKVRENGSAPDRATFGMLVPFASEMGDFQWAFMLCNDAIAGRCILNTATLQGVVDRLVKESEVEKAKRLVGLVHRKNGYLYCNLKLPLED